MTEGVVRSRQNFVISKNFVDSASDAEFGFKFPKKIIGNVIEVKKAQRSVEISRQ